MAIKALPLMLCALAICESLQNLQNGATAKLSAFARNEAKR
jgi:hypothetical protein